MSWEALLPAVLKGLERTMRVDRRVGRVRDEEGGPSLYPETRPVFETRRGAALRPGDVSPDASPTGATVIPP